MDLDSKPIVDTLTLPGRPICENGVVWGCDGLAVATGESVHIITPTKSTAQRNPIRQSHWNVETVRVNQFSASEWPERDLTTIQDASIGEEQSDSIVVKLDWSAPGLGIHRRSVLAVLTSNLKLSLWESSGIAGQWNRSLIINPLIQTPPDGHEVQGSAHSDVRWHRIRAFAWLKPLFTPSSDRWGSHLLALANDRNQVFICRVRKSQQDVFGHWELQFVWQGKASTPLPLRTHGYQESELEKSIRLTAPITALSHPGWSVETEQIDATFVGNWIESTLHVGFNNHAVSTTRLSFQIQLQGDHMAESFANRNYHPPNADQTRMQFENAWERLDSNEKCPQFVVNMPGKPWSKNYPAWERPLRESITAYNQAYSLHDYYRIRFWGFTYSAELNLIATCATLHPLDMFEYTTPVTEKSIVAFRTFLNTPEIYDKGQLTPVRTIAEIHCKVLSFLYKEASLQSIDSSTDAKILQTWDIRAREMQTGDKSSQKESVEVLDSSVGGEHSGQSFKLSIHIPQSLSGTQTCDACNSPFSFDFSSQTPVARCQAGHAFVCCSLSLIVLQEPGISKYCSDCERAFLNLATFQTQGGPCLSYALFDVFDTCVYCGGKYRGR